VLVSGVELGGIAFFQSAAVSGVPQELIYAGSRKGADYTGVTITAVAGSDQVTGSGTAFLANVDPGMFLYNTSSARAQGIVKSVESNTALTLLKPIAGSITASARDFRRAIVQHVDAAGTAPYLNPVTAFHAVVGQRLIRTFDNRAYFSRRLNDPLFYDPAGLTPFLPYFGGTIEDQTTDYHELPRAANITGADLIDNTLVLFTTGGVWAISNLTFDLFDAAGNVQHQMQQVSQDVVLWGDAGIVGWSGALLVPAIDDVYLFSLDGPPVPVSGYVRPLYRSYVEGGYKPGVATVYRGHYVLPIFEPISSQVADVLVCRLDLSDSRGARRPGWTRWANHARGPAYATRVGASPRSPRLLGINGLRVTDLSQCFSPAAAYKADADGTNHAATVITNDYGTGPGRRNTVAKVRAEFELVDAASDNPTITAEYAVGPEGSGFTSLTAQRGAIEDDGTGFSRWRVGKRADRVRFRFTTVGAAARFILRKVGVEIAPSGRG
jgi:hypothetical protein